MMLGTSGAFGSASYVGSKKIDSSLETRRRVERLQNEAKRYGR